MSEHDVFPPRKTDLAMPYNPDVMIEFWLHEYEDVLYEVFGDAETPDEGDDYGVRGVAERDGPAWKMLGDLMRSRGGADEDAISDSESVVTVGELGEDARLDTEQGGEIKENHMGENTWEVSLTLPLHCLLWLMSSTCHQRHCHFYPVHRLSDDDQARREVHCDPSCCLNWVLGG